MEFYLHLTLLVAMQCSFCKGFRQMETLVNVMVTLEWNNVVLLCDHELKRECMAEEDKVSGIPFRHVFLIKNLTNRPETTEIFEKTSDLSQMNWLVFCYNCVPLLAVINKYESSHNLQGYFTHLYQWIFVTSFTKTRSEFENNVGNITNLAVLDVDTNFNIYTSMFGNNKRYFDFVSNSLSIRQLHKMDIFPNLKHGLNGINLRVCTIPWVSYVIQYDNGTYSGYYIEVLNIIASKLNFTYTVYQPLDGKLGIKEDGEWNGIIQELIDKKADVVAVLSYSDERNEVVDHPTSVTTDYGLIIYHAAEPMSMSIELLAKPFSRNTWLCFGAITIAASLAFVLAQRWGKYGSRQFAFAQCIYIFRTSLNQGSPVIPKCLSSRITYSIYSLGYIIIMALYTALLVSFLAVQQTYIPFRTMMEVAENTEYKLGTIGGSLSYALNVQANFTPGTVAHELKSKMLRDAALDPSVFSANYEDHIKKLENEKYAFYSLYSDYEAIAQTSCSVEPLQEKGVLVFNGYMLQKNSIYTKYFNSILIHIHESELDVQIRKNFWPKPKQCTKNYDSIVRLENLYGVFYFLFVGILLAFLIFLLEFVMHKTKEHRHIISGRIREQIMDTGREWKSIIRLPSCRVVRTTGFQRRPDFESNSHSLSPVSSGAVELQMAKKTF